MVEKNPEDGWFILVYRLAIDARTRKGDDGAGGKCLILLKDFQTGTTSMARKRHLASSARVFLCFCLMAQIEVQEVQEVQKVQIRLIRGRKEGTIRGGRSIGPWLRRGL